MPIPIPESSTTEEHPRYRKPRNHFQNRHQPILEPDPNPPLFPCIFQSSRSKPTISSILLSTFSPTTTTPNELTTAAAAATITTKKKNFMSATFRGIGCSASSQVSVPAAIRSSANWEEAKRVKKKKQRNKKNRVPISAFGVSSDPSPSSSSLSLSSGCGVSVPGDVWCGPGIGGLTTDAASDASVDCVLSRRPLSGRGKVYSERVSHRERPSISVRTMVTPEDIPFHDPDAAFAMPRPRLDISGTRHHRHGRHGFPEGLAEIVMLQNSALMGGRSDARDPYRDAWRLDIDHMTYEELLELSDRIGYLSTGLREDEIASCLQKTNLSVKSNISSHLLSGKERKCSICQEEYEGDDEMGKLPCGHTHHFECIKQWLSQKNWCPVCKTSAVAKC